MFAVSRLLTRTRTIVIGMLCFIRISSFVFVDLTKIFCICNGQLNNAQLYHKACLRSWYSTIYNCVISHDVFEVSNHKTIGIIAAFLMRPPTLGLDNIEDSFHVGLLQFKKL